MRVTVSFFLILLRSISVKGIDYSSLYPRFICFDETQKNCNENFIDVYKNVSLSVTRTTYAETYFLLYTRRNPENPEKLHKCGGKLPPNSKFKSRKRTVIMFMPFDSGYCDNSLYREWTKQLLIREDLNIIIIDYSWGNHNDFFIAVSNVKQVVKYQVLILLRSIQEQTRVTRKSVIFLGHSLGGQLAGLVGHEFRPSRIIAVDPAGPNFRENAPKSERLSRDDADLVDVWHCNADNCTNGEGIGYDAGHINYYINGGRRQPHCQEQAFTWLFKGDILIGLDTLMNQKSCFHIKCTQYFKVSINPGNCQFVGIQCNSYEDFKEGKYRSCGTNGDKCLIMGWDLDKFLSKVPKKPKRFYVDTDVECPYCNNSNVELDGYAEIYKYTLQRRRRRVPRNMAIL